MYEDIEEQTVVQTTYCQLQKLKHGSNCHKRLVMGHLRNTEPTGDKNTVPDGNQKQVRSTADNRGRGYRYGGRSKHARGVYNQFG